jgi:hypothetical protein
MAVHVATPRKPRDDEAALRLLGKRLALGLCAVVATWFIGSSVLQITPAVFGASIVPVHAGGPGSAERRCVNGLHAQTIAETPALDDEGQSVLASACGQSPAALDAMAAVARLRLAQSQLDVRKASEARVLAELKHQLKEHLPPEMR